MGYLVLRMKYIECVRPESPKFDGISLLLSIAKKRCLGDLTCAVLILVHAASKRADALTPSNTAVLNICGRR